MAVSIIRTANPAGVTATSNVATYSDQYIGPAQPDRMVVVVVATELASSTPSGCTIDFGSGDTAMTAGTGGNFGAVYTKLYYLAVPTGTSATIKVTYSATNPSNTQNHIAVYAVRGANFSTTGGDGSTDMDATDPLTTGSITIASGGGFIAVAAGATDTAGKTWANATEDIDDDAGAFRFTTATRITALTTTAVTCTGATNGEDGAMSWILFTENTAPTVALNSPADASSGSDTTPTLDFTGTDADSDSIEYQVQIDTVNTFDSQGASGSDSLGSYAISNAGTNWFGMPADAKLVGQSFEAPSSDFLTTVKMALVRAFGSEGGTCRVHLYAHTGTFGTDGTPTGEVLATSDPVDLSTVPSMGGGWEAAVASWLSGADESDMTVFTFSNPYKVVSGTKYFFILEYTVNDYLLALGDASSPTAHGNAVYWDGNSWEVDTLDFVYYLYGGGGPLHDKLSTVDSGFVNPDTGGDTHPFNSGENIQFTVQAGDALAANTYYWRVRGIGPVGSSAYGAWSSTRSFTVTSGGSSQIKSIAGVTQANIKSIAGVTNANIKSIAGVSNV